jgi:hypothetical protein
MCGAFVGTAQDALKAIEDRYRKGKVGVPHARTRREQLSTPLLTRFPLRCFAYSGPHLLNRSFAHSQATDRRLSIFSRTSAGAGASAGPGAATSVSAVGIAHARLQLTASHRRRCARQHHSALRGCGYRRLCLCLRLHLRLFLRCVRRELQFWLCLRLHLHLQQLCDGAFGLAVPSFGG